MKSGSTSNCNVKYILQISDDEDETHPNIDTPSLFRWRHQARMERMEEQRRDKEALEKKKKQHQKLYEETVEKLKTLNNDNPNASEVEATLKKLEKEKEVLKKQEEELQHKEKASNVTPWNVDTISQPGFTKTVVNKPAPRKKDELSEEEKEKKFKSFIKENESLLKKFGMLKKYDDSKRFLLDYPQLACEDTANYLVYWCINLEMEEKHNLMEHVAHQCICTQFILELSKALEVDPRSCISSFFTRIQMAGEEYKNEFEEELKSFKEKIVRRAQEKLDAAIKEIEETEKQNRLGPGGLDPVDVYESLPLELQKCFDERDIPLLKETIAKMKPEEATYHMKRCVDSGLWVPDANKKEGDEEDESEETYEAVDEESFLNSKHFDNIFSKGARINTSYDIFLKSSPQKDDSEKRHHTPIRQIQTAGEENKNEFEEELKSFKEKIVRRAQEKLDAAIKEIEETENQNRLGPGGLDPDEVYESLQPLQKCFDERDIPLLKETNAKIKPEEATYQMKRCVDSGQWVPDANKNEGDEEDGTLIYSENKKMTKN
ncbi:hypothetical protein V9T40_007253 [Parthenolecanium corni]|uniref:Hsp90 co-chaperone Cdc37 n=1 Tax=Parthenolecanium corni TaxID=536013 RepID=A0AAN9TYD6_9HEMI